MSSKSKPSTFYSVHESEVAGSGKGCHWDKGPISQEMYADLAVNTTDALLSKKAYTPTVKSMATSSLSKGKTPIWTAQDAFVTEIGSDVGACAHAAVLSMTHMVPQGLKFTKKSSKEQPPTTSPQCFQAPHVLSGYSEAGPSNPGPEGHNCMGSEIPQLSPPTPETVLDWKWLSVEFSSDIPVQICRTANTQDTQDPVVVLWPYYFDIKDHSIKEASPYLPSHLVAIDGMHLELIQSSLPYTY